MNTNLFNRTQKRKKFNIVDILILLIIAIAATAGIIRAINVNKLPDTVKNTKITYTLEMNGLDRIYASSVKEGEKIYLSGKALYCGTVSNVQSRYSKKTVEYPDGTANNHIDPAFVDITLSVTLSADISENGFYIGDNTYLNIGRVSDFYTDSFRFTAKLVQIQPEI